MASLVPSSVALLAVRAGLFLASRRFLTNSLNTISLAGVSTAADALDGESGQASPILPLSRKLSNHGLSLLGGGSSRSSNATSAAGGALAEQPPPREPFARQHSDSNLVSLGLGRQRSTSGAGTMAGGGGRWFDRRGSSRKSAIDKSEKRLRGSNTSQLIFPLLFSESILLYLLVLCQSLSLLPARAREIHWTISLWALVLLLVVVVPGVQGWVLMRGSKKRGATTRLALTAIPFAIMQALFYLVPFPAHMLHESKASWLDPSLARLGVIGVLVLGALSGVGSINTALLFYSRGASSSWEEVTSDDLVSAERSLRSIKRDIADRELERERRTSSAGSQGGGSNGGWFGRMIGSVKGEDGSLEQELKGLRLMQDEVSRNLRGMVLRRDRMRFSRTLKGRLWNVAGYIFAIYCVLRLLLTIPSLLSPSSSLSSSPSDESASAVEGTQGDWLSYLLALALSHLPFEVDVALWSRLISLGLAGLIVASSVEYVLGWVRRVLSRVGGGRRGVGELGVLILSQLMALYLLSLLIQLRNSLPPSSLPSAQPSVPHSPLEPTGPEPQLLASLPPFKAFNRLFDLAYVCGAAVTALTAWLSGIWGSEAGVADGGTEIWRDDGA